MLVFPLLTSTLTVMPILEAMPADISLKLEGPIQLLNFLYFCRHELLWHERSQCTHAFQRARSGDAASR